MPWPVARSMKFPPLSCLSLQGRGTLAQWAALAAVSVPFMGLLTAAHVPASYLLGAMGAGIGVALCGGTPRPAAVFYQGSQGLVGCLVAMSLTPAILDTLAHDWPLFVAITLSTVLLCSAVGWILARARLLPGTTAIWGTSPGGATVMTLMSENYGGDMRIVAVMQYTRVLIVTVIASAVAHFGASANLSQTALQWFPPVHPSALAGTLAVGLIGAWITLRLRLPGGPMVWVMIVAAILKYHGLLEIELPPWLLAPAYAVLGWSIGLRFTPQALRDAARAMPMIIGSILALVGLCALLGWALQHMMGVDAITAYLATSPGGGDSVAIIAAGSGADLSFVMAFQTARLFAVMFLGPLLAQYAARRLQTRPAD